jgi:ABC-2 type transport system permease protein
MNTFTAPTPAADSRGRTTVGSPITDTLRIGVARIRVELKGLFRDRMQAMFTFTLPILLMLIFGSIFKGDLAPGVTFTQYFAAGMIASGIVYTAFQNLAVVVPMERASGALKRLRGTPMPTGAYFIGKVGLVVTTYAVQVTLLILIGAAVCGLRIPSTPGQWATFAWVSMLGLTACTLLGLAFSGLVRKSRGGAAIVTPIVLVLQFTSGVYVQFTQLPHWMQTVASFFPLRWLAEGMRSVFLPSFMGTLEPSGSFQHGETAIVLSIWAVVALPLAVWRFRWYREGDS